MGHGPRLFPFKSLKKNEIHHDRKCIVWRVPCQEPFDALLSIIPTCKYLTWIDKKKDSGNRISTEAIIHSPSQIQLSGSSLILSQATLHGDLADHALALKVGHRCFVGYNAVLRPPSRVLSGKRVGLPMRVGDFVYIGQGSTVEAASIGSFVFIGENVTIVRAFFFLPIIFGRFLWKSQEFVSQNN